MPKLLAFSVKLVGFTFSSLAKAPNRNFRIIVCSGLVKYRLHEFVDRVADKHKESYCFCGI